MEENFSKFYIYFKKKKKSIDVDKKGCFCHLN